MSTKRKGKPINGILLLDKASGLSSNAALQQVKRLFQAQKVGHTGSLDPLASGLLPLCFGEATKFSQYLLQADKQYQVCAKLGTRTTTSDAEGEVVAIKAVPALTTDLIEQQLDHLRSSTTQVPSMYSALKHKGQPLYKLARAGITVDRPARPITVYAIELQDYTNDSLSLAIHCSKGTYVRTLIDDLGEQLGCGAHVVKLRRVAVSNYCAKDMVSYPELESKVAAHGTAALQQLLLPVTSAIAHLPSLELSSAAVFYLRRGNPIDVAGLPPSGLVSVMQTNGDFVGVGQVQADGKLAPHRLTAEIKRD